MLGAGKQLGNSDVSSCPASNDLAQAELQLGHFVCERLQYARRGRGVRDVQPADHRLVSSFQLYQVRGLP